MAPCNCNNYYDPVGSQANRPPQGYTYSGSGSTNTQNSSQNTSYQTSYGQSYGNTYANQQYGTTGQQQQPSTTAASGLNSDYAAQASSGNCSTSQYDNSNNSWNDQNCNSSRHNNAMTNRSQANNSPLYATQSGSTFGRLSLPDQSQNSSDTFDNTQNYQSSTNSNASTKSYRNAPSNAGYKNACTPQQTQQQPQRYASPLHAVQAQQQGHHKQSSRASNHAPSPQMAANTHRMSQRQQSASVESSATTVDPSQVYDFRAEQEKHARIEAEKRRKVEAEQAARKAEEEARKAEEERIETEKREQEEAVRKAREAEEKKKAQQAKNNEQRREVREEKRQSKTAPTALQQMASLSSAGDMMAAIMSGVNLPPPANDEGSEMREMFKKMREFNQRNPAMLAKLLEEEWKAHAAQASSPQAAEPAQPAPAPAAPAKQQKQQKKQNQVQPQAQPSTVASAVAQQTNQTFQPSSSSKAPAQASPTGQQANAALRPPRKKDSLAEATAKWLVALPENQASLRTISKEIILKILDANPSYVQLCEAIERTGIRFERSALAKELMKAVPDGLRIRPPKPNTPIAAPPTAAAQINGAAAASPKFKRGRPRKDEPARCTVPNNSGRSSTGTVSYAAPTLSSLTDAAREVYAMCDNFTSSVSSSIQPGFAPGGPVQPTTGNPAFFDSAPMSNGHSPAQSVQPEIKPEEKPEEPPRPPVNKEEAARKRTFNDLVDLTTGDSDDEDGPPPRKITVPSSGPSNGVIHTQPPIDSLRRPRSFQSFMQQQRQGPAPGQGVSHPSGPSRPLVPQWPQPQPPKPQSPATVLSQPPPKQKGPSEENKQNERMRGKMLVEPIMRDRVARKSKYDSRTIARDVLLATGRHPDMRALNGHMNVMQKLLGDHGGVIDGAGNKSDLATIRWDIIDPGEASEEAKARAKRPSTRDGEMKDGDEADDDNEGAPMRVRELHTDVDATDSDAPKYVSFSKQIGGARGKGAKRGPVRPRQYPDLVAFASDKINDLTSPHASPGIPGRRSSIASNTPGRIASPSSTAMATGTPVGYAAFRQLDADGNPIKKKGRPVGWRKNIHSREAQGLTPKASGSKATPPAGSKLKQSTTKLVEPDYQVFKCGWRDCSAELDNLEHLRKHVVKIHGFANDEGDYECLWSKCRSRRLHVDANSKAQHGDDETAPGSFKDLPLWLKHVNKDHLEDVAWKLGDGPRGGSVLEQHTDSEAYLSDRYGRSVTPLIIPRTEQPQPATAGASRGDGPISPAKRGPGRPPKHGSAFGIDSTSLSKDGRLAAAELRKLEDQKRIEGPSMGLDGSRLVNEKRQRGFLDDEDFEDIVDDDEPDF